MSFAARPGCPMCGIVSGASASASSTGASNTTHEVLWKDDNFTAYKETQYPVSSKGHIIIAFNLHVPSIYTLSSSDLPLLVNIRNLAIRLLQNLSPSPSPSSATLSASPSSTPLSRSPTGAGNGDTSNFKIGFITPPFRDSKIPVTDHLHAHAYISPADLMGWFRGISYTAVAWYAIDDLIAEIRESVSNNRVKSGYTNRYDAPIDTVPTAGARAGTANGIETTEPGLGSADLEEADPLTPSDGSMSPISPSGRQSAPSSSSSSVPDEV